MTNTTLTNAPRTKSPLELLLRDLGDDYTEISAEHAGFVSLVAQMPETDPYRSLCSEHIITKLAGQMALLSDLMEEVSLFPVRMMLHEIDPSKVMQIMEGLKPVRKPRNPISTKR
jgi:hypothetical protein